MTLLFRIRIKDEIHEVRVEVPRERSEQDLEDLRAFVLSTAYLEHYGHLPKGVVNSHD